MTRIFIRLSIPFITALVLLSSVNASAADKAAGKEKAMLCSGCHGENGISISTEVPNLAGQKEAYLINTLKSFRANTRKNPIMNSMAGPLTDADIENLAAYFSSLKGGE